jgi:signal transduction histidine kinase
MTQQLKIEKMRTKIATDLHDDIGTSLSSISIFSQLAKRKIKGDANKTEEYLEKIEKTSRTLIDTMSDIVWSINPQNDSLEDAILKMKDFGVKLFEAKGIDVQMSVSKEIGNINLQPDIRRNLLLIFKEMVTNVAKHSGASNVTVEINIERSDHHDKTMIIKVEDDGIGFNVNKVYDGSGLKNLKARSDSINGEFRIISNENLGTSYLFQLQLKN